MPVIFIKFGATTFHVPADWNSADNSVICIGHGGWGGQAISAGDVLGFNVDSASTVTKATLTIKVTCT